MQLRRFVLQRLAPPRLSIIEVRLPHFPADIAEQSQEREKLGEPERPARKEGRKRLRRGREVCELMKNILLLGSGWGRRDRARAPVPQRRAAVAAGGSAAAFHANRNRFGAQGDVLFLQRIEIGEELRRNFVFAFVRTENGLERFRAADSDVVILFEIRGGRVLVPSRLIFEGRRRHPIEISAARNLRRDGERIAHLARLRVGVGRPW